MTNENRSLLRTICLSVGTFMVVQLPYLTIDSPWTTIVKPYLLFVGLAGALFTLAAGLSTSPGEAKELQAMLDNMRSIQNTSAAILSKAKDAQG